MEEGDDHLQQISTAEAVDRKHAQMLARLNKRHTAANRASRPDPDNTSSESVQSFLDKLSHSKQSIESRLAQIRMNPSRKPEIESVSLDISTLDALVAENSYFLPAYEIRACMELIAELKRTLDEVTSLVNPKKKFSFKTKKIKDVIIPANETGREKFDEMSVSRLDDELKGKNSASKDATIDEPEKHLRNEKDAIFTVGNGFRNRENAVLVDEGRHGEFTLSGLTECEVRLKGCKLRALFIDKLVDCKVFVGVVMGSILIEAVEGCAFVLASHQIRIHNAKNCDFYLRVRSRPIIEDCSGVRFAPYCLRYEGIEHDLEEANLAEENKNWENVDDFKWLRAVQSPNWSVLPENERIGTVDA